MNITTPLLSIALISAPAALRAQQNTPAFTFVPQVWTGATIGEYAFTPDTKIDTIVLADSGAIGFTAHRYSEKAGRSLTAVLSPQRLVAQEAQTIDGKQIARIATSVIAVSNAGQIAWEALFQDSANGRLHAGVFVNDHFATEFVPPPNGSAARFLLYDDGKVQMIDGLMPAKQRRHFWTYPFDQGLKNLESAILSHTVKYADRDLGWGAVNLGQVVLTDKIMGGTTPDKPRTALGAETKSCPSPAFPMPGEWAMGTDAGGPVAVSVFEQGNSAKPYDSLFYGHLTAPYRQVMYSQDCRPLTVAIGDSAAQGKFEVHTPSGILTYRKPDGSFAFPGFFQTVRSQSFLKSNTSWPINREGQIVLKVEVENGFAVLLAKPFAAR
ncbi:MAG: hypothetical protein WBY44_03140 [Bryobacteraceae bacterium]